MHITLLGSSTRCGKMIDFGCGMLNLLDDIVVSQLCRSRERIDYAAEVALLVPILCPNEEVDDMDVKLHYSLFHPIHWVQDSRELYTWQRVYYLTRGFEKLMQQAALHGSRQAGESSVYS